MRCGSKFRRGHPPAPPTLQIRVRVRVRGVVRVRVKVRVTYGQVKYGLG